MDNFYMNTLSITPQKSSTTHKFSLSQNYLLTARANNDKIIWTEHRQFLRSKSINTQSWTYMGIKMGSLSSRNLCVKELHESKSSIFSLVIKTNRIVTVCAIRRKIY